jgi:hypothetical protein
VLDLKDKNVYWPLKHNVDDIMLISKAFDKRKEWFLKKQREMKTFEWIIFKNPLEARGLHPLGAPSVHPMNHHPQEAEWWLLKHKAKLRQGWLLKKHKWKIKVISEKTWNEDLRVDYLQKSTRSSGATPCTQWILKFYRAKCWPPKHKPKTKHRILRNNSRRRQ